ncbi:MAG TPA: PEP-CTERM sorting domain-containing protein [Bryobacteraceae bacterium]|nr:PEP-CTERM sorting domain-containing protein [Bryobacteraceae bacterium]
MAHNQIRILLSLTLAAASPAAASTIVFSSGSDQVLEWEQSPDAVTLAGPGFLGSSRFVRLEAGGSVATMITTSALGNSVYGMTAAIARFSPAATWTLEVFAGGPITLGSGTPAGSVLLISNAAADPDVSTQDAPNWLARGTGYSELAAAPAAGTPIWGRIRATGGSLGVDAVLGVENFPNIWFVGENPSKSPITNWSFELDPIRQSSDSVPEPSTAVLAAAGLTLLALGRRIRRR